VGRQESETYRQLQHDQRPVPSQQEYNSICWI